MDKFDREKLNADRERLKQEIVYRCEMQSISKDGKKAVGVLKSASGGSLTLHLRKDEKSEWRDKGGKLWEFEGTEKN